MVLKMLFFLRLLFRRRRYVLADGMNSCVYLPKSVYAYLQEELVKGLADGRTKENSLRFLWTRRETAGNGGFLLLVNPDVEMVRTHGLTMTETRRTGTKGLLVGSPMERASTGRSGGKRKMITIPCPYLQQIYWRLGLPVDYCGKIYLTKTEAVGGSLVSFVLNANKKYRYGSL